MVFIGAGLIMAENIPDLIVRHAEQSAGNELDQETVNTLLLNAENSTGPFIVWNYMLVGVLGLCGAIGIGIRQGKKINSQVEHAPPAGRGEAPRP